MGNIVSSPATNESAPSSSTTKRRSKRNKDDNNDENDDTDDENLNTSNNNDMDVMERAQRALGLNFREWQSGLASRFRKLEEQDHPAAALIDSVCGPYLDPRKNSGGGSGSGSHRGTSGEGDDDDVNAKSSSSSRRSSNHRTNVVQSFYSDDVESEDDSRTISEDETTTATDYLERRDRDRNRRVNKSNKGSGQHRGGKNNHDDQTVESASCVSQSDFESTFDESQIAAGRSSKPSSGNNNNTQASNSAGRGGGKKSGSSRKRGGGRGNVTESSYETEDDDTTTHGPNESNGKVSSKAKGSSGNNTTPNSLLSKQPLASSFAKRCYFTKQGIGSTTQHYEGLTLTGNVVLMLAAAMKLKGCPTICDEDLRRVEQTYPNQFSRLPDELLLSSGWRRISKYCHFSSKPIPDGLPFFHSKQRLHPSGGYYFLLAASVGMVRPMDIEPLTRDTLVLLETDFPTQCDASPKCLIEDPEEWTLVDRFCFFSGGPINCEEDVYYQADFDGNPIFMLAFLSPSLTPAELYKLDGVSDETGEPALKLVSAVEDVESVYDLTERDFDDLKLYHLGPCRALPQYILQPQAWTKVLPPHFLAAKEQALRLAQEYEMRHRLVINTTPPTETSTTNIGIRQTPPLPSITSANGVRYIDSQQLQQPHMVHYTTQGSSGGPSSFVSQASPLPMFMKQVQLSGIISNTPSAQLQQQFMPSLATTVPPSVGGHRSTVYDHYHVAGAHAVSLGNDTQQQQQIVMDVRDSYYDQQHDLSTQDQSHFEHPSNTRQYSHDMYPLHSAHVQDKQIQFESNREHSHSTYDTMLNQQYQPSPYDSMIDPRQYDQHHQQSLMQQQLQTTTSKHHDHHPPDNFVDPMSSNDQYESIANHHSHYDSAVMLNNGHYQYDPITSHYSSYDPEKQVHQPQQSQQQGYYEQSQQITGVRYQQSSPTPPGAHSMPQHYDNMGHYSSNPHNPNIAQSTSPYDHGYQNAGSWDESPAHLNAEHLDAHRLLQRDVEEDGAFIDHIAPIDEALASHAAARSTVSSVSAGAISLGGGGALGMLTTRSQKSQVDPPEDQPPSLSKYGKQIRHPSGMHAGNLFTSSYTVYSNEAGSQMQNSHFREEEYLSSPDKSFGYPDECQNDDCPNEAYQEGEVYQYDEEDDDDEAYETDSPPKESPRDPLHVQTGDSFPGPQSDDFETQSPLSDREYTTSPTASSHYSIPISEGMAATPAGGDDEYSSFNHQASSIEINHSSKRENTGLPPHSPRSSTQGSEFSHSSSLRGAHELLRRNRARRLSTHRVKENDDLHFDRNSEREMMLDEGSDFVSNSLQSGVHQHNSLRSGNSTWDSASEITSVVSGGSSRWSDSNHESNNTHHPDRNSRRALILQMAKARMKSNKSSSGTTPTSLQSLSYKDKVVVSASESFSPTHSALGTSPHSSSEFADSPISQQDEQQYHPYHSSITSIQNKQVIGNSNCNSSTLKSFRISDDVDVDDGIDDEEKKLDYKDSNTDIMIGDLD